MSELFLIEKRGLYYRPDKRGYTGLKREAGRYPLEFASTHIGPNGLNSVTGGAGVWSESEAPECSTRCPWDVRKVEETRNAMKAEYSDILAAIDAQATRKAVLEEAAQVCDKEHDEARNHNCITEAVGAFWCAKEIRALAEGEPE